MTFSLFSWIPWRVTASKPGILGGGSAKARSLPGPPRIFTLTVKNSGGTYVELEPNPSHLSDIRAFRRIWNSGAQNL